MTQEEIRAEKKKILANIKEKETELKIAKKKDLEILQIRCDHPNIRTEYDSGWGRMPSTDKICDDCGYRKSY